MTILGKYSFAGGEEYVKKNFSDLLLEVEEAIGKVDASICLTKESKEKNNGWQDALQPYCIK